MPKAEYERLYQLLCNRSMVVTSGAFITEVSEDDDSSRGDAVERRISEVLNGNGIQPNGMESNEIQTNGVEPGIQSNGMEGFQFRANPCILLMNPVLRFPTLKLMFLCDVCK